MADRPQVDYSPAASDAALRSTKARRLSARGRISSRRWIALAILPVIAAPGVVLALRAGGGSVLPALAPGVGDFGGYQAHGLVRSVSASWRVPRVISAPRDAATATWIGVQGPPKTFIQVGTVEASHPVSEGSQTTYNAWWADTVSRDRPRELFRVRPGDEITATLRHRHDSWLVEIRDTTSDESEVFQTHQEGRGPYNIAEWTQEKSSERGLAYPRISPVTFRRLLVNGTPPDGGRLLSGWLATPEGLLAPTPLGRDSFTLRPTTIDAVGAQYLRIVAPMDDAAFKYQNAYWGWHDRRGSWQLLRADTRAYALRMEETVRSLLTARWPSSVRPRVEVVARASAGYVHLVAGMPAAEPSKQGHFVEAWFRKSEAVSEATHALRRELHLPDPT